MKYRAQRLGDPQQEWCTKEGHRLGFRDEKHRRVDTETGVGDGDVHKGERNSL